MDETPNKRKWKYFYLPAAIAGAVLGAGVAVWEAVSAYGKARWGRPKGGN
jgi:hypothetical protein